MAKNVSFFSKFGGLGRSGCTDSPGCGKMGDDDRNIYMSDRVENRGEVQHVPRQLSASARGFSRRHPERERARAVGGRGESRRIGEGRSQSQSHLVKPREKADRRSSARGGGQWCVWGRYNADRCGFKQFKTTGDGHRLLGNSKNWMQFLADHCESAGFDGGPARSNLVQVSPSEKFSRGAPIAIASSIFGTIARETS